MFRMAAGLPIAESCLISPEATVTFSCWEQVSHVLFDEGETLPQTVRAPAALMEKAALCLLWVLLVQRLNESSHRLFIFACLMNPAIE